MVPKPIIWLATLALCSWAPTAYAHHLQEGTEKIVRWAGCKSEVVTADDHSTLDSFFDGDTLWVGTAQDTPWDVWLIVLLHETGHCLQYQEYGDKMVVEYPNNPKVWELDADRRSAELACDLGLDGQKMLHDLLVWAFQNFDYDGDPNHGSLAERIHQGDYACSWVPKPQAPVI